MKTSIIFFQIRICKSSKIKGKIIWCFFKALESIKTPFRQKYVNFLAELIPVTFRIEKSNHLHFSNKRILKLSTDEDVWKRMKLFWLFECGIMWHCVRQSRKRSADNNIGSKHFDEEILSGVSHYIKRKVYCKKGSLQ